MRFETILLAVGAAGTAVLAATGAWGYRGVRDGGIEPHLMLAVSAAVTLLFAHVWVLVFLLATGRGLRRAAGGGTSGGGLAGLAALARSRRLAVAALGLAVAALAGLLASGAVAYARPQVAALHAGLFWAALALQAAALVAERRALGATGALIAALDR